MELLNICPFILAYFTKPVFKDHPYGSMCPSFHRLNNIPSTACKYHILLIHLATDGHVGCFHLLTTANNAMNIRVQWIVQCTIKNTFYAYIFFINPFFIFRLIPSLLQDHKMYSLLFPLTSFYI